MSSADLAGQTVVESPATARPRLPSRLERLETESIHIIREVLAQCARPALLYSVGKDSSVLLHLALKATFPTPLPMPLLHIDTGWKFREMIRFRDSTAHRLSLRLLVHTNEDARAAGVDPIRHDPTVYTRIMKTEPLIRALETHKIDAAFGGARRDEELSRAKERIVSIRSPGHGWNPRRQRPELWRNYNAMLPAGHSARVFPLSNWTELDVWEYIDAEQIPVVPLYFAQRRPVVERDGRLIVVDDERLPLLPGEQPVRRSVRFRTLGCYPLTAATESTASSVSAIVDEMRRATTSERQGRLIDHDQRGSMEKKKREGYF